MAADFPAADDVLRHRDPAALKFSLAVEAADEKAERAEDRSRIDVGHAASYDKPTIRSRHQRAAMEPMPYAAARAAQSGVRAPPSAISPPSAANPAIQTSWPISMPRVNANNASGMSPTGRPIPASAPANPRPCRKPKASAIAQGRCESPLR